MSFFTSKCLYKKKIYKCHYPFDQYADSLVDGASHLNGCENDQQDLIYGMSHKLDHTLSNNLFLLHVTTNKQKRDMYDVYTTYGIHPQDKLKQWE